MQEVEYDRKFGVKAMPDDLQALLEKSSAVSSLAAEQLVVEQLRARGWMAQHSLFYQDLDTTKWRELDAVGMRIWTAAHRSGEKLVRIRLFLERKTLRDYHIVFSSERSGLSSKQAIWMGYERQYVDELSAILKRLDYCDEDIGHFLRRTTSIAYPRHSMSVASLCVDPPAAPFCSSAFRETNTQQDKELDNSVFWRSILVLDSAIRRFRASHIKGELEDFEISTRYDRRWAATPVAAALEAYASMTRSLELIHPIVVLDASLWVLRKDKLHKVEWCRFERSGWFWPEWWTDVVTADYFPQYLAALTSHYERHLKRARAKAHT